MLLKKSRKSRLEDVVDQARDRIVDDYLPAASGAVAGVVAGAREAMPVVQDAAAEAAEAARRNFEDVVKPAAHDAFEQTRDVHVPAAKKALSEAADKAKPAAQAAFEKAREKAGETAGDVQSRLPGQKKKSSKGKKLLIGLGIVGVGAGVAKLVSSRQQQRTLPYVPPTPAPQTTTAESAATGGAASAAAATAAAGNVASGPQAVAEDGLDAGGSDPGEALSDDHAGPRPVTTPDAPADSESVEDPRS